MQTFIQYLIEKRSNPDKNKREDPLEQLRKYNDIADNVYISYTKIDKIGINPQSSYDTPNGIYTYQLDWVLNNSKNIKDVPWQGHQPHIWVISPTTNVLIVNDYTNNDLQSDIEKLRDKFNGPKFNSTLQIATQYNKKMKSDHPASVMWEFTKSLAGNNDTTNKWSSILRSVLGYYVIRDDGLSIIHQSQSFQTVFLGKSTFKVLEKLNNTNENRFGYADKSKYIEKTEKLKSDTNDLKQAIKIYLRSTSVSDLEAVFTNMKKFKNSFSRSGFKGELLVGVKEWKQFKTAIMNTHNLGYISIFADLTKDEEFKETVASHQRQTHESSKDKINKFKMGDKVHVIDGPFVDFDGVIKSLDNNTAKVEMQLFGKSMTHDIDIDHLIK